jgi:hypothetical protein
MGFFDDSPPSIPPPWLIKRRSKKRRTRDPSAHRWGFFDQLNGASLKNRTGYVRSATYELINQEDIPTLLGAGCFAAAPGSAEILPFSPIDMAGKVRYLVTVLFPSDEWLEAFGALPTRRCKVVALTLTTCIGLDSNQATVKQAKKYHRQAVHRNDVRTGEFVDEPDWLLQPDALAPVVFKARAFKRCRVDGDPAVELDMTIRDSWVLDSAGLHKPSALVDMDHYAVWKREFRLVQEVIDSAARLESLIRGEHGNDEQLVRRLRRKYLARDQTGRLMNHLSGRQQIAALKEFEYGKVRIALEDTELNLPITRLDNEPYSLKEKSR